MRLIYLLLGTALMGPVSVRAQAPHEWEFLGIGVEAKKSGCYVEPHSQYGIKWVDKTGNPTWSAERIAVRDSVQKEYGHVMMTPVTIRSDRNVWLAVVKRHIQCGTYSGPAKLVDDYVFVSGADSAKIVRDIQRSVEASPKSIKGFDVVQWMKLEVKDMIVPPGSPRRYIPEKLAQMGVRG